MSRDRTRAALALLCVVVVLFGGSLFPTAGFGSYPAGIGGGNGVPGAPGDSPGSGIDDRATPTPSPTEAAQTADDGQTETATGTPTPTPTPTETPVSDGPTDDGISMDGAFAGIMLIIGVCAAGLLVFSLAPGIDEQTTFAGLPIGRFQTNLRAFFAAVPRRTTSFLVGLSASVPGVLDRVFSVTVAAAESFGVIAKGLVRGSGRTLAVLGGSLGTVVTVLPRAFGGGLSALFGGLLRAGSGGLTGRRGNEREPNDGSPTPTADVEEETDPTPQSVEEAWAMMAERVPIGNRKAATPGEYARAAVAAGFPESAVQRLTRAFERVRYGGKSGRDELPSVRDALSRIRSFLDSNGGENA
ncbi:hypothetical protein C499_11831 [Halogeometricum borinquense DSM 11551]|uniref:Protein-glutamine gamma-glutamyltransferase-like C-terminal domain-containing protein n=2 Tax=Halogeometricum borinquense TaxID=60847 RepID=E4NTE7_HALBP|nr:DUF4129 domain-containing protein [Halogeometricum borinquense]ADQ65892.1 hypothetical protein Hbor_02820 [Halogeometricum borinquense DSM 11551]ELY26895.1 hypothetical protein C499_11831 [Halogeometricum borinquense DSM 11551]RYJ14212.1 DUF4129 domain-containing protein [Halogeometricum borinquense]